MEAGTLVQYRVDALERKVKELEQDVAQMPLIAQQVQHLTTRVDSLTKAVYVAGGAIVLGSITFAFSVFELIGTN